VKGALKPQEARSSQGAGVSESNRHSQGRPVVGTAKRYRPAPRHGAHGAPSSLNPCQLAFCLNYIANGFNATAAYKAAYPGATLRSARELGHRLLTKVDIRAFIAAQINKGLTGLQMTADEALARVAMAARADVRLLFDDYGQLLAPNLWPDEIACAAEALRFTERGGWPIRLASRLAGLRLILEQTGRLGSKNVARADPLAEAMRTALKT
jgi:hypothetical protein